MSTKWTGLSKYEADVAKNAKSSEEEARIAERLKKIRRNADCSRLMNIENPDTLEIIEKSRPGEHYAGMEWQYITDRDLERYYLGMVKDDPELAALESRSSLADHAPGGAEEAQDYVDAMRVAGLAFADPYESRH